MDTKKIQKTRSQIFEPCWRCIGSKLQKIAQIGQNFMDDFFGSKVSKWSNSKSCHVKSEIWRPSKNFSLYQVTGSTLRNFLKIFRKKNFGSKVSKWTNSSKNHIKSEIWGPSNFPFDQVTQVNDRKFLASFCGYNPWT